jgi:hypothetical protein
MYLKPGKDCRKMNWSSSLFRGCLGASILWMVFVFWVGDVVPATRTLLQSPISQQQDSRDAVLDECIRKGEDPGACIAQNDDISGPQPQLPRFTRESAADRIKVALPLGLAPMALLFLTIPSLGLRKRFRT